MYKSIGTLAATVQHELARIFPEYLLKNLMHTHEIYSIYYDLPRPPTGGDVFWKSENHPKPSKFKYQKGITINNRLGVLYNRKDYLCAMETVEIPSRTMLRMRRSKDVHRFMTNLLIYTMMYGGTRTDRGINRRYYREKISTSKRINSFQRVLPKGAIYFSIT